MKLTMKLVPMKSIFGAAAAAATVLAMGTVTSPAFAGDPQVSASPAGSCSAGGECSVVVAVKIVDDGIHVNTDYNHKVTANEAGGVTFLGKSRPVLFSKDDGDFKLQGDKVGVVTVRFKPAAKGKVTIAGTYKFATCKEGGGGCTPASKGFSVDVNVK